MSPENQSGRGSQERQGQPIRPITPMDLIPQAPKEQITYPIPLEGIDRINGMISASFDPETKIATALIEDRYTLQQLMKTYGGDWLINADGKGGYLFQAYEQRISRIEGESPVYPL